MKFIPIETPAHPQNKRIQNKIDFLKTLLKELEERLLPNEIVASINSELEKVNASIEAEEKQVRTIRQALSTILSMLQKELKIVCLNHYRNMWLAIGMAVFGIPLGLVFSISLDNMAFIGIGLPIGMSIGIALGIQKDNKAKTEGRQLNIEVSV